MGTALATSLALLTVGPIGGHETDLELGAEISLCVPVDHPSPLGCNLGAGICFLLFDLTLEFSTGYVYLAPGVGSSGHSRWAVPVKLGFRESVGHGVLLGAGAGARFMHHDWSSWESGRTTEESVHPLLYGQAALRLADFTELRVRTSLEDFDAVWFHAGFGFLLGL